jgi:hypothetical protein
MAHEKYDLPVEQLIRRYRSGETARDIGASLGVDYGVIQRRLKKAGVPLRGRGPTAAGRVRISESRRMDLDENLLRQLAEQGQSVAEIAAALPQRPSQECVRERMIALGIARLPGKARPEKNHFWSGGLIVDADGYILQKSNGHPHRTKAGYVRQHRLVMEQKLGRHLTTQEVVDHVNGDTSDNRPENLRLFPDNASHLAATLTGLKLDPRERESLRQQAVQRAKQRVAAILAQSETDGDPSQ